MMTNWNCVFVASALFGASWWCEFPSLAAAIHFTQNSHLDAEIVSGNHPEKLISTKILFIRHLILIMCALKNIFSFIEKSKTGLSSKTEKEIVSIS